MNYFFEINELKINSYLIKIKCSAAHLKLLLFNILVCVFVVKYEFYENTRKINCCFYGITIVSFGFNFEVCALDDDAFDCTAESVA